MYLHGETQELEVWKHIPNDMRPKIRYWIPAAAVDEDDLQQEIRQLKERGFGGIEIVTLTTLPDQVLTGEDGWGTRHWNRCIRKIAEITEELGMSMDIANGPGWPISMPTIASADDTAVLCELTYGVTEFEAGGYYRGELPEGRRKHKEGTSHLEHVMAYCQTETGELKLDSYKGLAEDISLVNGRYFLECNLPVCSNNEKWKIFAFYRQPAVQKTTGNQYYVIDHLSKAGVKACELYWKSIFDEYNYPSMESIFCDSLEYNVSMDWSPKMAEEFEKYRGYSVLPYLPFLGTPDVYPPQDLPGYRLDEEDVAEMVNRDYQETLTRCYCEYHLKSLEKLAGEFGKTIRYQVAYNKPFEGERCGLFVSVPENEGLGRPSMDYLKLMAAAVHIGRKKRYSFECAAEYGNSYGQEYEDLFWWIKRSLMAGMNAQVLHGASYSGRYTGKYSSGGYMEGVHWPGYEGFGKRVSNYWNRTLSVEDARSCMDTIARLNTIFRNKARIDCAVYRAEYSNSGLGSEYCFYNDSGLLAKSGYSYETVSTFLLEQSVCMVKAGRLDPEGAGYQCLIVPEQKAVPVGFLIKVRELLETGFPIILVGNMPKRSLFYKEWKNKKERETWQSLMKSVWNSRGVIHASSLQQVPALLTENGILPEVAVEGEIPVMTAVRLDEEKKITYVAVYAHNEVICSPEDPNPDEMSCSALFRKGSTKGSYRRPGEMSRKRIHVTIKGNGQVFMCNPWNGKMRVLDFEQKKGSCHGILDLEEDEMVILAVMANELSTGGESGRKDYLRKSPLMFKTLILQEFLPGDEEEKSFLRSGFSKDLRVLNLKALLPWRRLSGDLEYFAGKGVYKGSFFLLQNEVNKRCVLRLGGASDTFRVWVNGIEADFPDQVLKEAELSGLVKAGENYLEIAVVSNLYNALVKEHTDDQGKRIVRISKDYGIWDTEEEHCAVMILH